MLLLGVFSHGDVFLLFLFTSYPVRRLLWLLQHSWRFLILSLIMMVAKAMDWSLLCLECLGKQILLTKRIILSNGKKFSACTLLWMKQIGVYFCHGITLWKSSQGVFLLGLFFSSLSHLHEFRCEIVKLRAKYCWSPFCPQNVSEICCGTAIYTGY